MWAADLCQHFSDYHGMVWVGSCGAAQPFLTCWACSSFSPGCSHWCLVLCVPGSCAMRCCQLPAGKQRKRAQTKYLHRIIVFMIFSFYCRKGVQFRINTSDCWRCSLIRMNQVHVFLALVQSVFTNKSSLLKRPFSENPIQSSGNCYCPQVQGKFRAIPRKAVINLSTSGFFPFSLLLNHEIM